MRSGPDPSDSLSSPHSIPTEFIESLLPKVEWAALKDGATCLKMEDDAAQLPATAEEVGCLSIKGINPCMPLCVSFFSFLGVCA